MSKKATVSASKDKLQQTREKLGTISFNLESDINNIKNVVSSINNHWDSELARSMSQAQMKELEGIINEQATMIENIRKFLDDVDVKYTTLEKKLSSNADQFKKRGK